MHLNWSCALRVSQHHILQSFCSMMNRSAKQLTCSGTGKTIPHKTPPLQICTFQGEHSFSSSVSSNRHTCARRCLLHGLKYLLWYFWADLRHSLLPGPSDLATFKVLSSQSCQNIWGGHWEKNGNFSPPGLPGENQIPASVNGFFFTSEVFRLVWNHNSLETLW